MKTPPSSRAVYFFVPGLSDKYRTGGLMVIQDVAKLYQELGYIVRFVATHEEHPEALSPKSAFEKMSDEEHPLCVVTWGPLVADHIKMIRGEKRGAEVIYYAQSFGWGIEIPRDVAIVCVSRYVMAQWALHAPHNYISYVPPFLHAPFAFSEATRDIDVLLHTRKQNNYCLEELMPALEKTDLRIKKIESWISQEEFAALLGRTKIFLYITELHKAGFRRRLPGEGFGLPALEAVTCGAVVGSNLLGGVTDFLTPGENCIKLQNKTVAADVALIKKRIENFVANEKEAQKVSQEYSRTAVKEMWQKILWTSIN